jgi:hypothetical protein
MSTIWAYKSWCYVYYFVTAILENGWSTFSLLGDTQLTCLDFNTNAYELVAMSTDKIY